MARFNGYLKESFVRPLESRLKPLGLVLNADTANAEVGAWLREVANPRVHAETTERPAERFAREQPLLLPRAPRWRPEGRAAPAELAGIKPRFITAADLTPQLEAAQRQSRRRGLPAATGHHEALPRRHRAPRRHLRPAGADRRGAPSRAPTSASPPGRGAACGGSTRTRGTAATRRSRS